LQKGFNELTLIIKQAASELRKQAGDMFRCKKVKGERPSPFLFSPVTLKRCYNLLFSAPKFLLKQFFLNICVSKSPGTTHDQEKHRPRNRWILRRSGYIL
jgi:hypothetical protein